MNLSSLIIQLLQVTFFIGKLKALEKSQFHWFNDLTKYISDDVDNRQVIFISSDIRNISLNYPSVSKLLKEIISVYPTMRISDKIFDEVHNNYQAIHHLEDSTATFFIIVDDGSHSDKSYFHEMIKLLKKLSFRKEIVKYFLICLASKTNKDYDNMLRFTWTKQMVDFTIMELSHHKKQHIKKFIGHNTEEQIPKLHQFNPFLNSTSTKLYHPWIEWFPDIMRDLHGYPVNIAVIDRPPFSYIKWNKDNRVEKMSGADITLMETITSRMNFTANIVPRILTFSEMKEDNSPRGIFKLMKSGKVDILAYMTPHYTEDIFENSIRSEAIIYDEFCAVIPMKYEIRIPWSWDAIEAIIFTVMIVIIFWFSAYILRFDKYLWNGFFILRVLFGIPVIIKTVLYSSQRIMIYCLSLISITYSAKIYASLTRINTAINSEIEFKTFNDLDESGLALFIPSYLYSKTFGTSDDNVIQKLKNKAINTSTIWNCPSYAETYKNVSCLMGHTEGDVFVKLKRENGKPTLKFVKTCFWSDSYAFLLREGSSYRRKIGILIARFSEAGLMETWYKNIISSASLLGEVNSNSFEELKTPSDILRVQLMAISILGCGLAIIVFFLEILCYKYSKKNKKKD